MRGWCHGVGPARGTLTISAGLHFGEPVRNSSTRTLSNRNSTPAGASFTVGTRWHPTSCYHLCPHRRAAHKPKSSRADDVQFAITVEGVSLALGSGERRRSILHGLDLKVQRGSLHMLLGPNGCGKSTLLKVLGGLLYPDTGLMECDQPTGFVFQNPDHQVVMPTVAADVAFGLGRYRLPESQVEEAVAAALGLVNMSEFMHRATHTLSGGQRQRVAIAGALAEGPKVLLLDELTTFLDVEDQFGVLQAVKNITHKRRATAVWVTHRFEELAYADAATYMEEGRVVFTGSPEQLKLRLRRAGAAIA